MAISRCAARCAISRQINLASGLEYIMPAISESERFMCTVVREAHKVVYRDILVSLTETAARHKKLTADELIAILATTVGYLISSTPEDSLVILRRLALENLDNGILFGGEHMTQINDTTEKRAAHVTDKAGVPRRLQKSTH